MNRERAFDEIHAQLLLRERNFALLAAMTWIGFVGDYLVSGSLLHLIEPIWLTAFGLLHAQQVRAHGGEGTLRRSLWLGITYTAVIAFEQYLFVHTGPHPASDWLKHYGNTLVSTGLLGWMFVAASPVASVLRTLVAQLVLIGTAILLGTIPPQASTLMPAVQFIALGCASSFIVHQLYQRKYAAQELLRNLLPKDVAEEKIASGKVRPRAIPSATIVFVDIAGFTPAAARLSPHEVVRYLQTYMARVDMIVEKHGLEKIKTIGDAYLFAGLGRRSPQDEATAACQAAAEILDLATELPSFGGVSLRLRAGAHVGPIVAGVVGDTKVHFDIWGDTVNTAARLQTLAAPGSMKVSVTLRDATGGTVLFDAPKREDVRGRSAIETCTLLRN